MGLDESSGSQGRTVVHSRELSTVSGCMVAAHEVMVLLKYSGRLLNTPQCTGQSPLSKEVPSPQMTIAARWRTLD